MSERGGAALSRLEKLGLSRVEARAYAVLVRQGPLAAPRVAQLAQVPRSSVYGVLESLAEKGLIRAATGYASPFQAFPPEQALPGLIEHDREALLEREAIAKELVQDLAEMVGDDEGASEAIVEVIRNPRAVARVFDQLQLEAERTIDVFVKPPLVATKKGNPAGKKALGRGVKSRSLYEREALDLPDVAPYISSWTAAGEESRTYPGELPFKMGLFDARLALLPLRTSTNPDRPFTAILLNHEALCGGLRMLFDCLWEGSDPAPGS